MKVVTFNIRVDCEPQALNSFANRREGIRQKICRQQPALIGFQEVLPHVAEWLQQELEGYTVLSCGREKDYTGEAMTICYRKDALELLSFRTFWLSPTPEQPGSRFQKQSMCPRICTVAVFMDKATGKLFTFFNTHLDHEEEEARIQGIQLVLAEINRCKTPVILTGDFNTEEGSQAAQRVEENKETLLTEVTKNVGITFHDYGNCSKKLDYIFVSPEFTGQPAQAWEEMTDGIYLSDHYPVEADLNWTTP